VDAHGKEWKSLYGHLLAQFIQQGIFPDDIKKALSKTLLNPAATANGETKLLLVLRKYNEIKKAGVVLVAHITEGVLFESLNGKIFRRGKKRRIRIECVEVATGQVYSFSALTEVKLVNGG
jgi:fumarylacetoacetate (FAA) hydrolase family protein